MKMMFAAATALIAIASPAVAQDRWDWSGGRPDAPDFRMAGPGVRILYPELRETRRGRAFVMRNFDRNHDRFLTIFEARQANRAFAEIAGPRLRGFDWDSRDRGYVVEERGGGWDRGAMHGYGFRQTARGAMMRLDEDVLFATDSDVLRPGAIDKLRPLASYLRANPGVRVAIDGYTDSRGTDAHNQDLSERRADTIKHYLVDHFHIAASDLVTVGYGKTHLKDAANPDDPINRRVQVVNTESTNTASK